jgi:hypothetical protein
MWTNCLVISSSLRHAAWLPIFVIELMKACIVVFRKRIFDFAYRGLRDALSVAAMCPAAGES